jgi:hypothetical protein
MRVVRGRGRVARVDAGGLVWGSDGVPRRYVRVEGLLLDGMGLGEQDDRAAMWALIGASVPHKGALSVLIENLPADVDSIMRDLRAQLAPVPHTPELGALGERLLAWWEARLTAQSAGTQQDGGEPRRAPPRHVANLVYHVIVSPPPAQQGFPDAGVLGRLEAATVALEQRLIALGATPHRLDGAGVRAILARQHLTVAGLSGGDGRLIEPVPDEHVTALRIQTPDGRDVWVRSVYLVTAPPETSPGWMERLIAWEEPHTVFVTLRGLKKRRERKRQEWRLRLLAASATRTNVQGDIAQAEARQQATRLYEATQTLMRVGVYVRVEGATREEVDARVARLLTMLRDDMSIEPGYAWTHQTPLWRSMALGRDLARSTYRWDSDTWANGLPLLRHSPGTRGGIPFGTTDTAGALFTLSLEDSSLYNRIMCILGPTGRGKSTLLGKIILWMLLKGDMATVVDAVGGLAPLCAIAGGAIVRLGGPTSATLNVWSGARATPEDAAERIKFVTTALDLLLGGVSGDEKPLLYEGVAAVYDACAAAGTPVMSDLAAWLRGMVDATDLYQSGQLDPVDRRTYRSLLWKLRPYVGTGMHARLVDGPDSLDVLHPPLLVLDTEPLHQEPAVRDFAVFTALSVVRRRQAEARRRSSAQGRGTADHLTALEEAWSLLSNEDARAFVTQEGRTGRRKGSIVVFVSQEVADMTENREAATFFTQSSLKFLAGLEDSGQQTESNPRVWLAHKLNLADHEVHTATSMVGVPGAYHPIFVSRRDRTSPRDLHGVARIELSEEEAVLLETNPDAVRVRDAWVDKHGGNVATGIFAYADYKRSEARRQYELQQRSAAG